MVGSGDGDRRVHRPDQRAGRAVRAPRLRGPAAPPAAGRARRHDARQFLRLVLPRTDPARAVRRRRPRGARVLRLRPGARRAAGRHRRGCSGSSTGPCPDAPTWHQDVAVYDVVEDGVVRGRIYLDLHPREGKYKHAAQFDVVLRHRRRPTGRGRAGLQLPARADGAHRRRHAVPRVRPPRPPRARRGAAMGPVQRRRHRVGLRRGAVADARGVGVGRGRAAVVRAELGRAAGASRAGRADAGGEGLRQGADGPHPDVLRGAVVPVAPRSARRLRTGRARPAAQVRPVRLHRRDALLRLVRSPRGVHVRRTTRTCGAW